MRIKPLISLLLTLGISGTLVTAQDGGVQGKINLWETLMTGTTADPVGGGPDSAVEEITTERVPVDEEAIVPESATGTGEGTTAEPVPVDEEIIVPEMQLALVKEQHLNLFLLMKKLLSLKVQVRLELPHQH
ncbi:unnamed protein product [Owenia fusiformis]|uniref:Uncharacterized protein n=1 Tax=Owenia fusiformis TaxID=6347 RepID=A0A8J1T787_OWEFU|nr:unnamed protein product [Owenia fusiformis]